MCAIHKTMADNRWADLSFAEKMGNIGSEISRARSADERNDTERRNKSLDRANELVQLTVSGLDNARAKELGFMHHALASIRDNTQSVISLRAIEQYCLPFAILARKNI